MLKKILIGFVVGSALIVASFKLIFKIPTQPNLVTDSRRASAMTFIAAIKTSEPHALDVTSMG